jgi:hypothetical protein
MTLETTISLASLTALLWSILGWMDYDVSGRALLPPVFWLDWVLWGPLVWALALYRRWFTKKR